MIEECHQIYHMLPISEIGRPWWDIRALTSIGFDDISIDQEVSDRIYQEKDLFYAPDRLFRIRAVK